MTFEQFAFLDRAPTDDDLWDFFPMIEGPPLNWPYSSLPYPGLWIGILRVREVYVCQGWENEFLPSIQYDPVPSDKTEYLLKHGWTV